MYAQAGLSLCLSHIPHCWKSNAVAHIQTSLMLLREMLRQAITDLYCLGAKSRIHKGQHIGKLNSNSQHQDLLLIYFNNCYNNIRFGCVKETYPWDVSFMPPKLMFDRKIDNNHFWGSYILFYLPIIWSTDYSK